MRRVLAIAACLVLSASAAHAQQGTEPRRQDAVKISAAGQGGSAVVAEVDRTKVQLGDTVTFTITVTRLPGETFTLSEADIDFGKLELIEHDASTRKAQGEATIEVYEWRLGAFALGDHELPSVVVLRTLEGETEPTELTTNTIPISVAGVIDEAEVGQAQSPEQLAEFMDDEVAPLDAKVPFYLPLYILAGILGGVLIYWLAGRLARRRKAIEEEAAPPPPPRPAHEVAYERLAALKAEQLVQKGELKAFTFQISEILREYLGRRYGFDGLEMTSEELHAKLRLLQPSGLAVGEIERFNGTSDMVKFAKFVPEPAVCEQLFAQVETLVDRTKSTTVGVTPEAPEARSENDAAAESNAAAETTNTPEAPA